MKQGDFFPIQQKAYGGELLKTRRGRMHGRTLSTKHSMHLVLRSTRAKGALSFLRHRITIDRILTKFAAKNGVRILSLANVGNHLHLEIRLSTRHTYRAFIRAITAAIAMAVQGKNRWNKIQEKFWDYRPFTRIVVGYRALLSLKDYIEINQLEGLGVARSKSRLALGWRVVRPPG